MAQTEPKYNFDNKKKLEIVSKFEYLVRQLNNQGVDTSSINPE